jgi:hypothetical protein
VRMLTEGLRALDGHPTKLAYRKQLTSHYR